MHRERGMSGSIEWAVLTPLVLLTYDAANRFVGQVFPVCGGCHALTLPLSAGLGPLGLQPGARRTAGLLGEGP